MKTRHKATIASLAVVAGLAVVGLPALAHGPLGGGFGGMMGYGMMGGGQQGYGPGPGAGYHMGYGMGPGFGMGMMGSGFGPGPGAGGHPCLQNATATDLDLDVDGVKARLEAWLAAQGNARLTLGGIEIVDDDTITAEIVTLDNSLVQKLAIDRHTGWIQPAR